MRATFQILVFFGYVAALGWGGWYVLSGQMIADREAANPVLLTVPDEATDVKEMKEAEETVSEPPSK